MLYRKRSVKKWKYYRKNFRNERGNERRFFHGRNNVCNINRSTYIGINASNHFLGGGKTSQGERFQDSALHLSFMKITPLSVHTALDMRRKAREDESWHYCIVLRVIPPKFSTDMPIQKASFWSRSTYKLKRWKCIV